MKKLVFVVFALLVAFPISADIRRSDMDRKIQVSEGSQLMTQVDIVSLYLSSEKVSYEPYLGADQKIRVDVTVLSRRLMENREKMRDFISRQIAIFKRELARRVEAAAPSIGAHFNPDQDIIFEINEGTARSPVATVEGDNWDWAGGSAPPPKVSRESATAGEDAASSSSSKELSDARASNGAQCNDCPALIKKK